MIFKTYETNLDGISNKLGFSKRSFAEWGTQVHQSFNDAGKGLKGFKAAFTTAFIDKSTDIKLINQSDFSTVFNTKNSQKFFDNFNNNATKSTAILKKWCTGLGVTDKTMKAYLVDCMQKQVPASFEGYNKYVQSAIANNKQLTLSAKAGSVALKALSMAANMIAFTLITKGIQLVVKSLDKLANASKYATESAKSLFSAMDESIKSMSQNASTLSDLNDEYQELSKGVNQLGENISLSTNDYSRYKDIIRQVSTIMPNLTTYFNAQGEQIAFAKGELKDLNEEYNRYIQNEAIKFVTKGDDDGNKIQDILDNYNNNNYESLNGFQKWLNGFAVSSGGLRYENFTAKEVIPELEKLRSKGSIQEIYDYLSSYNKGFYGQPNLENRETAIKLMLRNELDLSGKTKEEIFSMTEADYNALMEKIIGYIDDRNTKIASDMNQVRTALLQGAYSKDSYWALENDDMRDDVITLLSSINSDVWDALNIETDHELNVFVNKIINSMADNTDGFADAWNGLFSPELEELSPNEYAQQINEFLKTICDVLDLDEINGVRIFKVSLGFENVDTLAQNYNAITKKAAEKFSGVTSQTYGNNSEADLYYEQVLDDLDAFAKENSINTQDEIAFWNQCIEESNTREEAMEKYLESPFMDSDPATFNDIFAFKNADDTLTTLGKISESIDTIQKAYNTLSSTIDEYNNNGVISIDTLQSVMELGDDWLDYLVAEDGALKLDKESLDDLAKSRLEEMRIRTLNNLVDQIKDIENNADANKYLTSTNYAAAESFEEVARTSALATAELLKAKVASGDLSQGFYDAVIAKMYSDINKINTLFDNASTDLSYKASSAASSAATSFTDLLDKELDVLDKKMEAGYIDFNDYIKARLDLIEDYYRQGKLAADEYYSYLEKHYKQELSYRDKVIKAVTRRIDKEIDNLEKQKDDIESYYKVQIDALEKEKTLLQDANKERQREIDLQKAMYELERARNQRTKLIYSEDKGMHYVADDSAIRDAQQEAENAEFEVKIAEIEKAITKLEEARDAETDAIDDMIDKLKEYRDQWNDITSAYEEAQEDLIAEQMLGRDWEKDILDTRLDTLNKFKDDYIKIQQAMVDAAYQAAQAMANAENVKIDDSSKRKTDDSTGDDPEHGWEVVDEKTATRVGSGFTSEIKANEEAERLNERKAKANGMTLAQFKNSDIPGYYVKKYHTGLKQGLVNQHSFDDDFKLVQEVGLGNKEVPAILKEGEAVTTPEQISNIADGLRNTTSTNENANSKFIPYDPDKDDSNFAKLYKAWNAHYGNIENPVEEISRHIMMDHNKQMNEVVKQITNNSNIVNNRNVQPIINQNITLNCPNLTNNSGIEYVQKELGHLSQMALQEPLRRY